MAALHYTHSDGVATLTLDNPPQNRLANELMMAFGGAVQDLMQRGDTRLIVLKAMGEDFSFGGDITPWPERSEAEFSAGMEQGIALSNLLQDLPVPILVAVQGHCRGGGFELTLRGDIIVAADNAQFGHSEATIGVFTFLGGVQRVAERAGRTRAMQWAMTSEMISAQTALSAGLVNEVVPLADLESATQTWIERLSTGSTLAHAAHKKLLRAWSNGGVESADALMAEMAGPILHTEDAQGALVGAIDALNNGLPRPAYPFKGR